MLIALSAVLSLVTIVSIYREGGILKRLRATPLRPYTILSAHVIVKLMLTAVTFGATMLVGRRYYPLDGDVPVVAFTLALMFTTVCILSIGFLIASVVPTARFAQPIGSIILYPMLGLSGLFMPVDTLPPLLQAASRVLPLTYAVSLLRASGTAKDGRRTAATWPCWRWSLWHARRCRPGCFGGSDVVCGGNDPQITQIHGISGAQEPARPGREAAGGATNGRRMRATQLRAFILRPLVSPPPLRRGSLGFRCCRAAACRSTSATDPECERPHPSA